MNNERLVAYVDDATDTVARMKGRTRTRIVLDGAMVVAMLDFLQLIKRENEMVRYGDIWSSIRIRWDSIKLINKRKGTMYLC